MPLLGIAEDIKMTRFLWSVLVAGLMVIVVHAEDVCTGNDCGTTTDEGAGKYYRSKNQPGGSVASRVAKLQSALMNLMQNPHDKKVLSSSLVELAEFIETPEGKRFLDHFSDMLDGGGKAGPAGAMVQQLFSAVLAGNVDLGGLMKNGLNAESLASLASGVLKKDSGGSNVDFKDVMPLLKNFLQVVKEEQGSPFMLDKLTKAFEDTLSMDQLKNFEKSAAGVLSSIAAAKDEKDSNFEYDTVALESFESFSKEFFDTHQWDWETNKPTFMAEIKKVLRSHPGSEDHIGRHLPSVLETIADDKPTESHRREIITNFGGIIGFVVGKDNSNPDFVLQLTDKLRTPLKSMNKEGKETATKKIKQVEAGEKRGDINEPKVANPNPENFLSQISDLIEKFSESSKGSSLQQIMQKVSSLKDSKMEDLENMMPEFEGMDKVKSYLDQVQQSGDEKEMAEHFHKLMDVISESFDILNSKDVRLEALNQVLPYIRMAHDFLKDPMALFKIQMGIVSLTAMYQTTVDQLVKQAAPYVDNSLSGLGIQSDLETFVNDAKQFLLQAYQSIYQSPNSVVKTMTVSQLDEYTIESMDHSLAEPLVLVFEGYRTVRKHPECLLQTLCSLHRNAKETDKGHLGLRPAVTKVFSRLFGILLVTSEYGLDSPVHEQILEALDEGEGGGNCEMRYPGCSPTS